jgi:hypothetical protein
MILGSHIHKLRMGMAILFVLRQLIVSLLQRQSAACMEFEETAEKRKQWIIAWHRGDSFVPRKTVIYCILSVKMGQLLNMLIWPISADKQGRNLRGGGDGGCDTPQNTNHLDWQGNQRF